jgi:hypothetical protein
MIRTLKYAAILAAALSASAAFAQAPPGTWAPDHPSWGWDRNEWSRPFNERPGYENLNDCTPGSHGVPFPNGNGFRCVANGWE